MAQTQTVLDQGITELVKLATAVAATGFTKIVVLNMATACAAVVGSTFADPCDTATHHVDAGLSIAAVATMAQDTVNTAGDTISAHHVFTASDTRNAAGLHLCNTDGDVSYLECCFNAVLAMENTDTLTVTVHSTINQV